MLANDKVKKTIPTNDINPHMKYQNIKKARRSKRMWEGSSMIETTEPIVSRLNNAERSGIVAERCRVAIKNR